MYVPAQQSLSEWLQSNGAESGQPAGIGSLAPAGPSPAGGFPAGDLLKLGKFGFQQLAPETYKAVTNWVPSISDIAGSLGFEGFGATGLGAAAGGLASAASMAGPFYAWAKIMSAINQNTDHPITLGSGYTSLEDGFYGGEGPRVGEAKGLADLYRGDGGWYAGGDPSMVDDDMRTAFGSMSWKKTIPFWSVGGVPYSTPTLAANSGRSIARQQMGLPVVEEPLPSARTSTYDPLFAMIGDRSLPVFDGGQQIDPNSWDQWQDRAQNSGYFQQSNTEASQAWAPETIMAHTSAMDPRTREWFDSGLNTGQMYAFTGQNSPDWELNEYLTAEDDTLSRVAAANGVEGTAPLNVFEYAMGPGRVFNPERTNLRSG
jgi:hypothetical protein